MIQSIIKYSIFFINRNIAKFIYLTLLRLFYIRKIVKIYFFCLILFFSFAHSVFSNNQQFVKVDSLIKLYNINKQIKYINKAFSLVENNKNQKIQNILFKCIADSNLRQIKNIINRYNYLQSKAEIIKKTDTKDSLKYNYAAVDSFKKIIFKRYSQYTYFILSQDFITIQDIQQNYLQEKQVILDYVISDDYLHIFIIRKDTFDVFTSDLSRDELLTDICLFTKDLYLTSDPLKLSFNIQLAHKLYLKLIKPAEKFLKDINTVIIIPDDVLLGVPFGCFVVDTTLSESTEQYNVFYSEYKNINFLIKNYSIAYNYSVLPLADDFHKNQPQLNLGRKLLTVSQLSGFKDNKIVADSSYIIDVPIHASKEVERISRLMWRHENITGNEATLNYFKKNSNKYRWLYLAIPGVFDNIIPRFSSIFFSQSLNNQLFIADIINLKLCNDLITITGSECVPLSSEEKIGLLGLPQSFLIAGVRSVLFSLWQVRSITVSEFMAKYYWELKFKRQTNIIALQQAKIASLEGTFEFKGYEVSQAHPYFWSSFMLIGNINIRPPTFSIIPPHTVILIIYLIVLIVSLIIVRKTVDKKNKASSRNEKV